MYACSKSTYVNETIHSTQFTSSVWLNNATIQYDTGVAAQDLPEYQWNHPSHHISGFVAPREADDYQLSGLADRLPYTRYIGPSHSGDHDEVHVALSDSAQFSAYIPMENSVELETLRGLNTISTYSLTEYQPSVACDPHCATNISNGVECVMDFANPEHASGYLSDSNRRESGRIKKGTFICKVPGCSTKLKSREDRRRHENTVHMDYTAGKGYRCAAVGCPKADKIWARLDNFKLHLAKKHGREDANELVQKSRRSHHGSNANFLFIDVTPELASKESGLGKNSISSSIPSAQHGFGSKDGLNPLEGALVGMASGFKMDATENSPLVSNNGPGEILWPEADVDWNELVNLD
ncbi:hypothetical protein BP6252_03447 [Coleophoma cylindrospora]|uniref:C2H2-type domain-containing protein n=1 Tax=Coleophoma cylindrospora TaxID=1849047 RepID=A0A3D8S7P2_9HELO|nr:hypothetical protein BP6252_03447 [Coleophoma cylindrospora]